MTVVVRLDPLPDPVETLARFADTDCCLLHSAAARHPLSRYSFLGADPVAAIQCSRTQWPGVRRSMRQTIRPDTPAFDGLPPMQGGWMGWLCYELGETFEPALSRSHGEHADVALGLHDWVIAWDHQVSRAWLISSGVDANGDRDEARARSRADAVLSRLAAAPVRPRSVAGNCTAAIHADFTRDGYCAAVSAAIEHVYAGDIFQVNLSQRFTMPFRGDALGLYTDICRRTEAPMSAFARIGGTTVISASPERFVRVDASTGTVETRPIKGTRPRGAFPADDAALALELVHSEKDRAENVMIVDLMRNDLSRTCRAHTVRVTALHALESHPTVHHLVSTITGSLREGCDALDVVETVFPGGSITGAPKIRAMEIIREREPVPRGVYSGAMGWIGLDGSMDTNIAIRTITIAGHVASVHAGGGITALSRSDDEFQETMDKAGALLEAMTS